METKHIHFSFINKLKREMLSLQILFPLTRNAEFALLKVQLYLLIVFNRDADKRNISRALREPQSRSKTIKRHNWTFSNANSTFKNGWRLDW